MLRRGRVTMEVFPRVPVDEVRASSDRELTSRMHRWYIEKYADMRRRLETPEYWAPYEAYRRKYKVNV